MVPPFETVSAPILQMKKLKLIKVKVHDQWKLATRSSHVILWALVPMETRSLAFWNHRELKDSDSNQPTHQGPFQATSSSDRMPSSPQTLQWLQLLPPSNRGRIWALTDKVGKENQVRKAKNPFGSLGLRSIQYNRRSASGHKIPRESLSSPSFLSLSGKREQHFPFTGLVGARWRTVFLSSLEG